MRVSKLFILLLCSLFFVSFSQGCEREGPAEKAGKKVDKAAEEAKKELKDTSDKIGQEMEKAGEKMQK
jgi:hypothetical protein